MSEFDLIVVGGGSGGLAGAFRAAEHGARVALLEPGELGGTCVNLGCVPKKAMWLAAQLAQDIELAARLGFAAPPPAPEWDALVTGRQRYIAGIHESYRRRLKEADIVHLPVRGRLAGERTVETSDGARLRARHILLATGSLPRRPDIPGAELGGVSDDFFNLSGPPGRVAIVGGGYIALELSGILQALGSQVDLLVRGPRLLSHADEEVVEQLRENHRQLGVGMRFGHRLRALERRADGRLWPVEAGVAGAEGQAGGAPDGDMAAAASARAGADGYDAVLFAIGRDGNTAGLGLEAAGVAIDEAGSIVADDRQDTNVPGIHAVGDVTGRAPLTPVAIAAARRLMDRLFGGEPEARLDYETIPTVVFAQPALGMVGLTEAEARERHGDAVRVYGSQFRPMLRALADSPLRSFFKLICVGEEERVVGLHLLGDGADEILQGFAVAIKRGITRADLLATVAIHPTSAEEVVLMR